MDETERLTVKLFGERLKELRLQSILGHESPTMSMKYAAMINDEGAGELHRKFSPVENLKKKR